MYVITSSPAVGILVLKFLNSIRASLFTLTRGEAIGIVHSDGTFYLATSQLEQGIGRINF